MSEGKGDTVTVPLEPPLSVHQIIIFMTIKNSTDPAYGYSLYEVEAYGPTTNNNLVTGGTAEGSTTQQQFFAGKAIDGDPKDPSRWSSDPGDSGPQKFTITLSSPQLINRIVLYWEAAYAVAYRVCVSP
jgi:hypothetical protein